ncbi:MAG TPA: efflux RND transporter periplasmic adaptor subunit [Lachnospiraceae bacterium]|nr:efflux RND transporter periplasmic adaptor subunit [Lachnospiraceae bacterium]
MEKKNIVRVGAVVAAILVCAGIYVGFAGKPKTYLTGQATYGSLAETLDVTGTVRGGEETVYYADVTAPIAVMDLEIGDSVEKGTGVVFYDTADLEKIRDEALLTAEASESNVNALLAESNKNASKYAKASADEQTYMLLYALSRADANAVSQEQYTENYQLKCQADGIQKSISDKSKQAAEKSAELARISDPTSQEYKDLAKEVADLNVDVANLQKDLVTLPDGDMTPDENAHITYDKNLMEDISRNWTQAVTDAATAENQILNEDRKTQLEKTHELSLLSLQTAQDNLEVANAGVYTEYAGVVTAVSADAGAVVTKGAPLFTIESTEELKVDVELSKYDIGKIAVGQKADIVIAGMTYPGTVTEIKKLAQKDASDKAKVTAEVKIDEPDDKIVLGIEADVDIHTEEKADALVIPIEAYYTDDGGDYCYLISEGVVEKRYITVGISGTSFIEVSDGISEGEVVITDAITDDAVGKKAEAK